MISERFCLTFSIVDVLSPHAENLLSKMNDLIALVKKLEKDISNQHGDVRRLQSLIENCAGC